MKVSILLDRLPHKVEIDGQRYLINADYRVFVRFELMMQDDSISDEDKLAGVLLPFYRFNVPQNTDAAISEMLKVYTRRSTDTPENDGGKDRRGDEMIYSYEHDGSAIFAAFMQCYGIDLSEARLHWWKFKALLENLPDDCEFMKAVSYRAMEISGKLPPEEQKRLRALKKFYALPDNRTAAQKERDFADDFAALF